MVGHRRTRALAALGLLAVIAFGAATLLIYPPPNCDEVYYASPFVTWQTRGTPGLDIYPEGDPTGQAINSVQRGRLHLLAISGAMWLLGVSLWAARASSLLGWLLAGALTYLVGARLYSRRAGLLAAAAFLTSIKAFFTSHLARPEIWLAAGILLAVYTVWLAVERKRTFAYAGLAGAASAATVGFHPHGLAFLFALALAFGLEAGWRSRRWALLGGYLLGGLAAGAGLAAAHAWPSPQDAWRQFVQLTFYYTSLSETSTGPGVLGNLRTMPAFLGLAYWTAGGPLALLEAILGVAGLAVAAWRRTWADEVLIVVVLASMLAYGLIFSQRLVQYGVLWSPLLFILGLAALERLAERFGPALFGGAKAGALLGAAGLGIAALNLAGDLWLVQGHRGGDFAEMNREVGRLIPAGVTVFGDPNWWWGLQETRDFISDDYLVWLAPAGAREPGQPGAALEAWMAGIMAELRPGYILVDSALGCEIDGGAMWAALKEYAGQHCEPVGVVDGGWLGDPQKRTSLLAQSTTVFRCSP